MAAPTQSLRACAVLVAVEALALAGVAVFFVVEVVVATPADRVRALVAAFLALLTAVGLGLVARALAGRRRWARAPALVVNLLVLPVAVDLLRGGRWYVGGPLVLYALVVLVLLFLPATEAALED